MGDRSEANKYNICGLVISMNKHTASIIGKAADSFSVTSAAYVTVLYTD